MQALAIEVRCISDTVTAPCRLLHLPYAELWFFDGRRRRLRPRLVRVLVEVFCKNHWGCRSADGKKLEQRLFLRYNRSTALTICSYERACKVVQSNGRLRSLSLRCSTFEADIRLSYGSGCLTRHGPELAWDATVYGKTTSNNSRLSSTSSCRLYTGSGFSGIQ